MCGKYGDKTHPRHVPQEVHLAEQFPATRSRSVCIQRHEHFACPPRGHASLESCMACATRCRCTMCGTGTPCPPPSFQPSVPKADPLSHRCGPANRDFKMLVERLFLCANDTTFSRDRCWFGDELHKGQVPPRGTGGRPGEATGRLPRLALYPNLARRIAYIDSAKLKPCTDKTSRLRHRPARASTAVPHPSVAALRARKTSLDR